MKLNANNYRINIPQIKLLTEKLNPEKRLEKASGIAVSTNVPIIIVLIYLGELYGFSEEIMVQIEFLKTFYKVTEIINIKKDLTS